jgi:hypothetical protein
MRYPWLCPAYSKVAAAALNDLEYLTLRKRGIERRTMADARWGKGVKRIFRVDEYPGTAVVSLLPSDFQTRGSYTSTIVHHDDLVYTATEMGS